jgi:hypothetical protein
VIAGDAARDAVLGVRVVTLAHRKECRVR